MRKILIYILAVICAFTAVAFYGCSCDGEEDKVLRPLNYESKTISRYEYFELAVPEENDGNIVWYSSDDNIVSVDKGTIFGVSKGKATVYAEVGGITYYCEVSVFDSGKVPVVKVDYAFDRIYLTVDAEYLLLPYVSYNTDVFSDGAFSFVSSDDSVVSVDNNGNLKAKKSGKAFITVSAVWRGSETLYLNVDVDVA